MLDGKHMVGVGFGGGPPDISAFYENDPRMRYVGNENGAGIRWLAEIRRRTVVGIKFLWAPGITAPPYAENSFLEGGELHARLINTTDSLQQFRTKHSVGIVWPVSDAESIRYAGQYGTERMVKDRFQDFEFFVDNVRFPDEQGP